MNELNAIDHELRDIFLELLNNGEIKEHSINHLQDLYEELENTDLNKLNEHESANVQEKLDMAKIVLKKYEESYDNSTIIKTTVYLTPFQLHYLDKISEKHNLISHGKRKKTSSRSAALRYIIEDYRKHE